MRQAAYLIGHWVERCLDAVLAATVLTMVGVLTWQVFLRYVMNAPNIWSDELARLLLPWVSMLGSAALMRRDDHIAVTVFVDLLPPAWQLALRFVRDALILTMAGALVHLGLRLVSIGSRQSSSALEIPMSWPYMAIPLGAALIAFLLLLGRIGPPEPATAAGAMPGATGGPEKP